MRKIWVAGIGLVIALGTATVWAEEAAPSTPLVAGSGSGLTPEKLPTVDEILVKMKAKWDGMKSIEMDWRYTVGYGDSEPRTTTTVHMVGEKWEKEGMVAVRSLTVAKREKKMLGVQLEALEVKAIDDGKYVWTEHRNMRREEIRVTKEDSPKRGGAFPDAFEWGLTSLAHDARDHDMKVAGEEIIDGQKMYVLEGSWDATTHDGQNSKVRCWIGEDDLLVRKYVDTHDEKNDKIVSTMEISNVRVDQKVDPKVFEYVPPAGATIEDMTRKKEK